jgi:TetR/AcrR family transcriptional regulator, transcriptional repressor for nem operon
MQHAIKPHADALLEAGLRLCRRVPLSRVTTAVIATEAGLPSVRFREAYPDLNQYLIDLYQQHFLHPVRQTLERMLGQLSPGLARTQALTEFYLDFCLKHAGLRRWTIDARVNPAFDEVYNQASAGFQGLAKAELRTLGFKDSASAARLFAAIVYEVALVEVHDGQENPSLRQCLWRLLGATDRAVLHFPQRPGLDESPQPAVTATSRQRLLHAGEQLLRDMAGDIDALKLDLLLARAHVDRAVFESHFGDLDNFQLALVQSWTEHYMSVCLAATQGLPPGTERLHAFLNAAWNHNLNHQRGVRLLMKAMLRTDSEMRSRILGRIESYTRMVALEFQVLGLPSCYSMARLFIAASTELVEAEEQANKALPLLREAFWQFFDPLTSGALPDTRKGRRLNPPPIAAQTSFLTMQIGDAGAATKPRKRRVQASRDALRRRLVDAGDRLLLSGTPTHALTAKRLSLQAGVELDEVNACYPDFKDYLTDLFTFLLDEVRDITVEATASQRPGIERMWRGIEVFLDARQDRPAIHELSRLLQGYAPAAKLSRSRNQGFVRIFAIEFASAGWPDAQASGHLITALVSETVQAEYEARRRLPEYRATLRSFLTRG